MNKEDKKLPCSAHADEQDRIEELNKDAQPGDQLKMFEAENNEEWLDGKTGEPVPVPNDFKLRMEPTKFYNIDLEKIKSLKDMKGLITALNITFTNPNDEMLPWLKEIKDDAE